MSEDRYRSVVDNSPLGICRVTRDGRFVAVNPALCAIVGYTAEELLASSAAMLRDGPTGGQEWLETADERPRGESADVTWRHKNGSAIAARVWVYTERDASGQVACIDAYVEDVTPIRAAEQARRQSERLADLGELAAGVAHELNNPLAAILLFAEDLLASERTPEEAEALGIIAQQARRSRAIVRDLLSFVAGGEVTREPVGLEVLLVDIARALQPQVSMFSVSLHVEVPRDNAVIVIDRVGIEQVITNLIINAAQAAGPGGNVWLRTRTAGGDQLFEIIDDGPGLSSEALARIFEPFFTTKPKARGSGLGLSVSLGIAQRHGGTITAANREPGDGSGARFTLRIPRVAHERPDPRPPAGDATGAADRRRVLVVDDEPSIRRALVRFFTRRGWEVAEAENGARALQWLADASEEFDLIISDVTMPELSGIEFYAALEALRPEMLDRIVFCTGETQSAPVAEFFARTGCRAVLKPFDLKTLGALSDEIVSRGVAPL